MNALFRNMSVGLLLTAAATSASALPVVTNVFRDPTGTVTTADVIPIYITVTVDPGSVALKTDASGYVVSGFDPLTDMPTSLPCTVSNCSFDPNVPLVQTLSNGYYGAQFETSGAYHFDFAFNGNPFNAASLVGVQNLDIEPGQSQDFLFGTFTPTASVAPGTYTFLNMAVAMFVTGNEADEFGNPVLVDDGTGTGTLVPRRISGLLFFGHTCESNDPGTAPCGSTFTRDVVAAAPVPLPPAMALLGPAVAGVFAGIRRRNRNKSVR